MDEVAPGLRALWHPQHIEGDEGLVFERLAGTGLHPVRHDLAQRREEDVLKELGERVFGWCDGVLREWFKHVRMMNVNHWKCDHYVDLSAAFPSRESHHGHRPPMVWKPPLAGSATRGPTSCRRHRPTAAWSRPRGTAGLLGAGGRHFSVRRRLAPCRRRPVRGAALAARRLSCGASACTAAVVG